MPKYEPQFKYIRTQTQFKIQPAINKFPKKFVYPFFGVHILMFGIAGFFLCYGAKDLSFAFIHGGIAISVYLIFYLVIFGIDEVKWMVINSLLSVFQIHQWLRLITGAFGVKIDELPWTYHIIPGAYLVIYLFLFRQMFIDLFRARDNPERLKWANSAFVTVSSTIGLIPFFI